MLKLVIVDCDDFHLFGSLAAKQGGELFVNNDKLYHVLHQCFGVFNEQVPSAFIFTLFHISRETLEGLIGLSPVWLLGMIQTVAPQSTCRLTGLELTRISQ